MLTLNYEETLEKVKKLRKGVGGQQDTILLLSLTRSLPVDQAEQLAKDLGYTGEFEISIQDPKVWHTKVSLERLGVEFDEHGVPVKVPYSFSYEGLKRATAVFSDTVEVFPEGSIVWVSKEGVDSEAYPDTTSNVYSLNVLEEFGFVRVDYTWMFGRTVQRFIVELENGTREVSEPVLVVLPYLNDEDLLATYKRIPAANGGLYFSGDYVFYPINPEFKTLYGIPEEVNTVALAITAYTPTDDIKKFDLPFEASTGKVYALPFADFPNADDPTTEPK